MTAMEKKDKTLNVPHLRFPEFSGEWEKTSIGDCCSDLEYGMNAASKNFDGVNKYIRITDIDELTAEYKQDSLVSPDALLEDKYLVKDGDILFARTGASTGKTYIYAPQDGKLYYAGFLIRANVNFGTNPKFVFYQTQTHRYKKWVSIMSMRSGQPGINSQEYASYQFWKPTKEEQDKISDLITLLDQRIKTQKKIIKDLKKLKDAINNSLHNNINEFQLFSFNELGNDYSGLTGKSSDDFGSGLPYISYLNVFRNDIVTDGQFDCVKVSKTEKQNVVSYGDLLFTLSSETPSEVGIGAIYLGKTNPIYLNSFCFGVHLSNQENIYGQYLAYFVTSQYFRKTILPFAQGSTRYNLMKSDFLKHKFCFPNMATQKAIYNALHTLSEKIQNQEVCLNKYTDQKQYLLARLFI